MEREAVLINAIKSMKSDSGEFNIIADSLEILVKSVSEHKQAAVTRWDDIGKRLGQIEYILHGTEGSNGLKSAVKEQSKRLNILEDRLSTWITRASTAMILVQVILLPVLIWIFNHIMAK